MFQKPPRLALLISGLVVLLGLGLSLAGYRYERQLLLAKERNEVLRILSEVRGQLEHSIYGTTHLAQGLVAYIQLDPELSGEDFRPFAQLLKQLNPHIRHLALAPDNRVKYLYPLEGNEKALGVDLSQVPEQQASVAWIEQEQQAKLNGPVTLVQGGEALILRIPVFISRGERQRYWGHVSVPIYLESIMRQAGFFELGSQLRLVLRGKDGLGSKGDMILGDAGLFNEPHEELQVQVPGGSWVLAARPQAGWLARAPYHGLLLGLLMTLLMGWLSFGFLRGQGQLAQLGRRLQQYVEVIDHHILTFKASREGIIREVSHALCLISGRKRHELQGQHMRNLIDPAHQSESFEPIWAQLVQGEIWQGEFHCINSVGKGYWVEGSITPVLNSHGKLTGYTAVLQDISDKKRVEQLSITDPLTGLYNRRYFNQCFETEFNRVRRQGKLFAFLMLDVDHFKRFNDQYGHQAGDQALIELAQILKQQLKRAGDYAFRLGGEEFGALIIVDQVEQAQELAEAIRLALLDKAIPHRGVPGVDRLTVSLGLFASEQLERLDPSQIYRLADQALYEAKSLGRNRLVQASWPPA